tara:strand:- start:976 stop:1098 length:123 start_codon:yes stop_codon:yes gene_type:complete
MSDYYEHQIAELKDVIAEQAAEIARLRNELTEWLAEERRG